MGEGMDAAPRELEGLHEHAGRTGGAQATASRSLTALCALARLHQVSADPATLAHQLGLRDSDVVGPSELLHAARHLGLKAKISRSSVDRLNLAPLPALALIKDHAGGVKAVVLAQCDGQRVLVQDPASSPSRPTIEPVSAFAENWSGDLVLVTSRASLVGELAKFDFSWFVPALVKYRRLLGEVLLISLFLQLFALVSPLFFQVVMDKVLVHRGVTTLDVLVMGLVVVVVFESLLTGLRSYVFSHTTSRIDVELGARLFRHLVQLPLAYFQSRRVGDSVARVRELENIRSFLTGNAMTVLLDVVFSTIFVAVMLFYSVPLTLIVLVSLPLYACVTVSIVPILRKRLDVKFARGAENQAMLVETVAGIQTVKASALEPSFGRRWDNQLAAYVSASFRTQTLASWAHEGINLIGKLVNAGTLWYGAHLVMNNELSVGQFVAFNMFAQRVAQPIMRMAQLWTDFQQTGISMARLGDILNTRTEVPPTSAAQLPPIKGRVTLDAVTFRYRAEAAPVLNGVGLDVRPGEVIGIVGRSGSGKSTLTKLVQRLYTPEQGRLLVDGIDISLIDALVELDPTSASADKATVEEQIKADQSEVVRAKVLLQALQAGGPMSLSDLQSRFSPALPAGWTQGEKASAGAQLAAEWSDVTAKLAKFGSEVTRRQAEIATVRAMVAKLETTLPLARQREEDFKRLAEQGFVASHAGQDRMPERIELERDLATERAKLTEAQASLTESENGRASCLAETRRALYDREAQADLKRAAASQEQAKAAYREKLTTLTAPVDDVVQQLTAHTAGGVVTEAQVLMILVPDGAQMTAEVTLENKDIGFVNVGQDSVIKLETFTFTRYGTIPAKVEMVTADAVNDEERGAIFPVTLSLAQTQINVDGKMIRLAPGMNLTAEIKTGKRRAIEYLLSPIQRREMRA